MARLFGFLMMVILVVIGLSFAVLNSEPVMLNYYFGSREIPLSLIVVGSLATGALFGVLASLGVIIRLKSQTSGLRKKVRMLEKDTLNIASAPAKL